jgi:hypothetical protein
MRTMPRWQKCFLLMEVAVSFTLPSCMLFIGLITLPLWLLPAAAPLVNSIVLSYLGGGCLGIIAVIGLVRNVVSNSPANALDCWVYSVLGCAGEVTLLSLVTGEFSSVYVDLFNVLFAVLPSLCFAHLLFLVHARLQAQRRFLESGD